MTVRFIHPGEHSNTQQSPPLFTFSPPIALVSFRKTSAAVPSNGSETGHYSSHDLLICPLEATSFAYRGTLQEGVGWSMTLPTSRDHANGSTNSAKQTEIEFLYASSLFNPLTPSPAFRGGYPFGFLVDIKKIIFLSNKQDYNLHIKKTI